MSGRKILVTSALPYANGDIHIGHLVEYIQTDVWVRFQKLRGENCRYFCADDTHGAAITISARKKGVTEEEFIAEVNEKHRADFAGFGIEFDHYGSTNSPQTRRFCDEIWAKLRSAGFVAEREIEQLFDPVEGRFLADRFVRGTCPKCGKTDQYGDSCECGAVYSPTELIDPKSALSGATPELRKAKHLFVEIEKARPFLERWIDESGALQPEIANYLKGQFLGDELWPWDVSRPAPYFGFEIPDSPGNYWYVWFDAPIGYMGSTLEWCEKNGEDFDGWWRNPETEIHHFIGKDITYFHTLFWPATLQTAGFNLPKKVHIHGFLTVDGEKMSKSKGTFVLARTYLKHLDPSYLRYFFSTKTSSRVDDLDLNLEEMELKVNADLVGVVVNLASRTAKFANATGLADVYPEDGGLFAEAAAKSEEIAAAYEERDFGKAIRTILECGYRANRYVEEVAPWTLRKEWAALEKDETATPEAREAARRRLQDAVTVSLNLFRQVVVYLAPVLPELAKKTEELLNTKIESWNDAQSPILGTAVNEYRHMMARVPKEGIAAMLEESKETLKPEAEAAPVAENTETAACPCCAENAECAAEATEAAAPTGIAPWFDSAEPLAAEPMSETITIDDFLKVDLRVGRIIEAEQVKEARKLLKLKISLGGDETRQVFAGIKAAYPEAEKLIGKLVVFVANLQPRQMKFGLSEGMVVASGPGGPDVFLTFPDEGAKPGMRLH
ncbi:MAG: methionine--tRNA ligase [Thermoguttaceae bacterium]|nr:methionine--tRNA ligase [Thermoguttaceae bacterium]